MKRWTHPTTNETRIYINDPELDLYGVKLWLAADPALKCGFSLQSRGSLPGAAPTGGSKLDWLVICALESIGLDYNACSWQQILEKVN